MSADDDNNNNDNDNSGDASSSMARSNASPGEAGSHDETTPCVCCLKNLARDPEGACVYEGVNGICARCKRLNKPCLEVRVFPVADPEYR